MYIFILHTEEILAGDELFEPLFGGHQSLQER
jgi:hypothetical protein